VLYLTLTLLYPGKAESQIRNYAILPAPDHITGEEDDRVATLWWNDFPHGGNENPPGVYGYQIQWGMDGKTLSHTSYAALPVIQLQPLVNGQPYDAVIRAIDAYGNLSAPSGRIHFTGSAKRVDALRKQMNGFFDDFNLPAGPVDELKWNVAFSHCNDPGKNGFFINDQFHVHSMLCTKFGDRGQIVSRPRAPFLIAGRTGTIVFDFDGAQNRDFWYLDLLPQIIDITGHVDLDTAPGYPGNMLRIRQHANIVDIIWIDADGKSHGIASSNDLMRYHIKLVPNVRRHWKVLVSQSLAQVYIDDRRVCAGPVQIPWTVSYLHWNAFSYNTRKANEPQALMHWDNFGFDAPAGWSQENTIHNYRTVPYNGSEFTSLARFTPYTTTIAIPDSVENAVGGRLMFAMQMAPNRAYSWDPNDSVSFNGHKFTIRQPGGVPLPQMQLLSGGPPYCEVIPIPANLLKHGANVVTFAMKQSGVLDLHLEVDYPSGHAPPYTQPAEIAAMQNLPMINIPDMEWVGPSVVFRNTSSFNFTYVYDSTHSDATHQPGKWLQVSGLIYLPIRAGGDLALSSSGKQCGITRIQILADDRLVATIPTDAKCPAIGGEYDLPLDTRQLSNGHHEISLRGTPGNEVAAHLSYSDPSMLNGVRNTLHIDVSN
jgi:hypothetical protein